MDSDPNFKEAENQSLIEGERRTSERFEVSGRATIRIRGESLEAVVKNRSSAGFLLVIEDPIEVEIELGQGAARHTERAFLRRIGGLPGGQYGIGLELVPDEPVE